MHSLNEDEPSVFLFVCISGSMPLFNDRVIQIGRFNSELFLEAITVSDVQVERILPCSSKARYQPAFRPRKSYTFLLSLSSALFLNLALFWAYLFYGNRVRWQLDMGSHYENLCVLLH